MSQYTTELRHLISAGYVPSLTDYPIFDEAYRPVLNQKIINHYYFREIGLETADRFDHYLKTRMAEIMPGYNILYAAQLQMINPLQNVNITETLSKQAAGSSISTTAAADEQTITAAKGKVTNKLANSDTPQGNLSVIDLTAGGYASNVQVGETTEDNDVTTTAGNNSGTAAGEQASTENYTKTLQGLQNASKPDLYLKLQRGLISIDQMLMHDLSDLFMGVY